LAQTQNPYNNLTDLQHCLNGDPGWSGTQLASLTECVLAAGQYSTSVSITFNHSNYMLTGTVYTSPWDTTITRGNQYLQNVINVAQTDPQGNQITNVYLTNIGINGNRLNIPSLTCLNQNDAFNYRDVDFGWAEFSSTQNVYIANSPGDGLRVYNGWIWQTNVISARWSGIDIGYDGNDSSACHPNDPTNCGNAQVANSELDYNGTAGVTVYGAIGKVWGSSFFNNRHEQFDGIGGGQLILVPGNQFTAVYGNTIDGNSQYMVPPGGSVPLIDGTTMEQSSAQCPVYPTPSGIGVDGIEIDGFAPFLEGNWVTNNSNAGLLIHSDVSNLYVNGVDPNTGYGAMIMYNQWGARVQSNPSTSSEITVGEIWIECNDAISVPPLSGEFAPFGILLDSGTTGQGFVTAGGCINYNGSDSNGDRNVINFSNLASYPASYNSCAPSGQFVNHATGISLGQCVK
jgi:hypothetical protein